MNFDFIEPFVSSTKKVLGTVLRTNAEYGDVSLRQGYELTGSVAVVIGIQDGSGESVILNMDEAQALGVCSAMSGVPCEALDAFGIDALGEMANMIAGNAVSALNDRGYDFKIHPPKTVGKDELPALTAGLELLQVPVRSGQGTITVNFTMRTN